MHFKQENSFKMKISIYNFGPIKNAVIDTKQFNFFIGNTSTGKSVAAKLITIFNSLQTAHTHIKDFASFQNKLADYCIDFQFGDTTAIHVIQDDVRWHITKNSFLCEGGVSTLTKPHGISDFPVFAKEFAKHYADKKEDKVLQNARISMMEVLKDISKGKIDFSPMTQFQKDLMYYSIIQYFSTQYSPVYIPAERILISIYTNSIFNLLQSGSAIPQSIKNFGSLYESARDSQSNIDIDFMKMKVKFSKDSDTIILNDGTEIKFNQASSGIQSLIPLWTVLIHCCNNNHSRSFVIEEPELNLFPTLQLDLISNIIKLMNNTRSDIIITTHSPYILSIIDNLIFANDVYTKAKESSKQNLKRKVLKLVKKGALIDYENVAAYCFNEDGTVDFINDQEMRSTGSLAIDEASTETSHIFNELMSIEDEL